MINSFIKIHYDDRVIDNEKTATKKKHIFLSIWSIMNNIKTVIEVTDPRIHVV